jgi:hypothetical protein
MLGETDDAFGRVGDAEGVCAKRASAHAKVACFFEGLV